MYVFVDALRFMLLLHTEESEPVMRSGCARGRSALLQQG